MQKRLDFFIAFCYTIVLGDGMKQELEQLLEQGYTLQQIGEKHGVSRQRIYQLLTKYGIESPLRKRKNFLRDKGVGYYWLNKILGSKKINKLNKLEILEKLNIPTHCPMLGIELNYDGVGWGKEGWTRGDDSPSLDRIDSEKDYTVDNIHIISWRANRIKNDSTPEELMAIAKYMLNLTK